MEAAGPNTIATTATGCLEVFSTAFPETAWRIPWIHSLFENSAAVAAGIEACLRTADIGIGCLSGVLERNQNVLYVCYDNEAYMNTGVQRSGLTPYDARTSTSPPGTESWGNQHQKKNLLGICAAHMIPYAATASVGFPQDLMMKVKKALKIEGAKFLQVHVPCPLGWIHATDKTIEVARLAVNTGLYPIVEMAYNKVIRVRKIGKNRQPVEEYLKLQGRFKHLFTESGKEELEKVRQIAQANIDHYGLE
jgi:pyruvate ferredoxin oxidoreductase beta subunit